MSPAPGLTVLTGKTPQETNAMAAVQPRPLSGAQACVIRTAVGETPSQLRAWQVVAAFGTLLDCMLVCQLHADHLTVTMLDEQRAQAPTSSLPWFFRRSSHSKMSLCQGSRYTAKAPLRLPPPWSTYLHTHLAFAHGNPLHCCSTKLEACHFAQGCTWGSRICWPSQRNTYVYICVGHRNSVTVWD